MRQVFDEMQTLYEANLVDRYYILYNIYKSYFTIVKKLMEPIK